MKPVERILYIFWPHGAGVAAGALAIFILDSIFPISRVERSEVVKTNIVFVTNVVDVKPSIPIEWEDFTPEAQRKFQQLLDVKRSQKRKELGLP